MRSNPIDRLRCFRRTQREYFEDEEEKRRSASHPRRQKERKRLSNEDAETFLSTSSSKRAGRGKNSIPRIENWKTKRKRKKLLSFSMQSSTRKSRRLQSEKREREKRRASSSDAYLQKKTPTPSSSREDAWEKHVCLSVCSLSICRRQKSVAKFDDVFSLAKRLSTPLNPTILMFRVLVVQKKVRWRVESFCSY